MVADVHCGSYLPMPSLTTTSHTEWRCSMTGEPDAALNRSELCMAMGLHLREAGGVCVCVRVWPARLPCPPTRHPALSLLSQATSQPDDYNTAH
jgi:hypothetical protein